MTSKGNDGSGNTPERDNWETPQELWDKLNKQYKFTFDCCASSDNHKCNDWTDNFRMWDPIGKVSWINPPFSRAEDMFKHFFKAVNQGVGIYRCDNMETKIWQDVILANADWIFIPKGRVSYQGKEGKGSRFPSALIGKGVSPIEDIAGFTFKLEKMKDEPSEVVNDELES